MDPVVHFEMPYDSAQRLTTFYQKVFGWKTQQLGAQMGDYVLAHTSETDEKGPKKPGMINGGFFPRSAAPGTPVPSVVVSVDDIRASMRKVTEAGGTVHGEPMEIPGIGQFVPFSDTEGNRLSMIQPLPGTGQGTRPG